jgi:hypothetical protein
LEKEEEKGRRRKKKKKKKRGEERKGKEKKGGKGCGTGLKSKGGKGCGTGLKSRRERGVGVQKGNVLSRAGVVQGRSGAVRRRDLQRNMAKGRCSQGGHGIAYNFIRSITSGCIHGRNLLL